MEGSTVWLVGMMGAGKSAVGQALAERRGARFEDSDALIEARARRPIPEIFAEDGEQAFRRLEREVIESLAGHPGVVALGGGAICQPGAAEMLRGSGTVAYLRATPETLAQRVGEASVRPLLAGLDPAARLERIRELLAEREIHYGQADVTLDTDTLDIDAASAALARALEAREGQGA
ncbi:MAG: shikimate kinase [Deltaproteobacteria bacterium]|nr:shikimate kinase [Deltaproteobacteria bacterium]